MSSSTSWRPVEQPLYQLGLARPPVGHAVSPVSVSRRAEDRQLRPAPAREVRQGAAAAADAAQRARTRSPSSRTPTATASSTSTRTSSTGLNIASAALHGAGGIWVLNPPYLLFYPDAERRRRARWRPRGRTQRLRPGGHALASPPACNGARTAGSTAPTAAPPPATSAAPRPKNVEMGRPVHLALPSEDEGLRNLRRRRRQHLQPRHRQQGPRLLRHQRRPHPRHALRAGQLRHQRLGQARPADQSVRLRLLRAHEARGRQQTLPAGLHHL